MKFFVDAQLPFKLVKFITDKNIDAIHTNDLPNLDRTEDNEIREMAQRETRIVITKDSDFLDSYLIKNIPQKLLFITTGNIKNKDLITLFNQNIENILKLFETYNWIELNNEGLLIHE